MKKPKKIDPYTVESLEEIQEDQKIKFCCAYEKLKTQNASFKRNEMLKFSYSYGCEHFG